MTPKTTFLLLCFTAVNAFARPLVLSSRKTALRALSPTDATAQLFKNQDIFIDRILKDTYPDLSAREDLAWSSGEGQKATVNIGGAKATLNALEGSSESNIAWVSSVHIEGKQASFQIINGPLSDIPHLYSRILISDTKELWLDLDFRPRSYGAYETKNRDDGSYPSDEHSAARELYAAKFGDDTVMNYLKFQYTEMDSAEVRSGGENDCSSRNIKGPICLSLKMPFNDHNIQILDDLRDQAAKFWFMWAMNNDDHKHAESDVSAQEQHDAQFRLDAHAALLEFYQDVYGKDDGGKLAAAESGPIEEDE